MRVTFLLLLIALQAACGRESAAQPREGSAGTLADAIAAAAGTAGGEARRIWSGDADMTGSPSPDGRLLSFTDWVNLSLGVRDLETGENRIIVAGSLDPSSTQFPEYSVFSPDGGRLVYSWFNGRNVDLRVVGVDGADVRVIHGGEGGIGYLYPADWTPDGREILVAAFREDGSVQIGFVDEATGTLRVLKSVPWANGFPIWEGGQLALSPDGRYIAFNIPAGDGTRQRDIHVLAADGSAETVAVRHAADDIVLGWMPDGRLLFGSDRGGSMGIHVQRMRDGRADGAPVLVKPDVYGMMPIGVTRAGRFYYGMLSGGYDVYVAAVDAENGRVLAQPAGTSHRRLGFNQGIDWSADGRYVAYLVRLGIVPRSRAILAVRDERTGEVRELDPELDYMNAAIRWSPDGRGIILPANNGSGQRGLFRIDVATGRATLVVHANDAMVQRPDWSPDGRVVFYFMRSREQTPSARIVSHDLDSGAVREIVAGDDLAVSHAVSFDGSRLAFVRQHPRDGARLYVMPAAGGAAQELHHVPAPGMIPTLAWARDGKRIVFARTLDRRQEGVEVWSIAATGGEAVRTGITGHGIHGLRTHPDGRRIGYTAGESTAEVWVLDITPAARTRN